MQAHQQTVPKSRLPVRVPPLLPRRQQRASQAQKQQLRANAENGMTEVAFHFNAPDKLAYACRFARKLVRSDRRLVITAPQPVLDLLDVMLWRTGAQDFIAHGGSDSPGEVLDASPVLLLADPQQAAVREVLLNLGQEVPAGFGSYQHLIEVVSADDEGDRQQARQRWRHYAGRGYAIARHDLVLKS